MRGRDNRTVTAVLGPGRKGVLAYGYEKAYLRKMAREAAVTIGAMYGYFPGKELLFKALAPDTAEELLALYDKVRGMRTVGGTDRGVVLRNGYAAEQGPPEELAEKKGIYHHMAELQKKSPGWSFETEGER